MTATLNHRNSFFFWASLAMLCTVVFSFAPTHYFRSLSGMPDMVGGPSLPSHLHLHGALLTAWYLLPVLQTALIAKRRPDLHRMAGFAGLAIAVALIPASIVTVIQSVPRFKAAASGPDDATIQNVVIGDLVNITIFFPLMLGIAIAQRNTPQVHKHWMYLTYLLFLGPVLSRFALVWQQPWLALLFSPLTWFAALIIYDVRTLRRVHSATIWGILTLLASLGVGQLANSTSAAHSFLVSLGL